MARLNPRSANRLTTASSAPMIAIEPKSAGTSSLARIAVCTTCNAIRTSPDVAVQRPAEKVFSLRLTLSAPLRNTRLFPRLHARNDPAEGQAFDQATRMGSTLRESTNEPISVHGLVESADS